MIGNTFNIDGYAIGKEIIDVNLVKQCKLELASIISQSNYINKATTLHSVYEQWPDKFSDEVSVDSIPNNEIYIGTSPLGLSENFQQLITNEKLWGFASDCLKVDSSNLVLNLVQLIRKPARIGPKLSWHRDFANKYVSTDNANNMIRILVPLQAYVESCGATAVIPSSHNVHDIEVINGLTIDKMRCEQESRIIPLNAGDLLAIHSKAIHGSSFNTSSIDRDQIVIQLAVKNANYLYQEEAKKLEPFFLSERKTIKHSID